MFHLPHPVRCVFPLLFLFLLVDKLSGTDFNSHSFHRFQLTGEYYSEGCAAGDLNRDGHDDVIYGPHWYAGPKFETRHEIYRPQAQSREGYADHFFAWVHDFDGDEFPDILTAGFPGTPAYVYRNPGAIQASGHWEKHLVFSSVCNESPQFTDIVGDANPELVCSHDGYYGFATYDGHEPQQPWVFHAVSEKIAPVPFGHGLGVGDLNGDGRKDILITEGWLEAPASESPSKEVAGGGRWVFHPYRFSESYGGADMLVEDVDGDGDADVITSLAAHDFGIAWFEQVRDGDQITFQRHLIVGDRPEQSRYGVVFSEPHALRLVDLDGDGLQDFLTGKTYYSHHQNSPQWDAGAVVYWFQQKRTSHGVDWIPHRIDSDSGIGRQIATGDFNRDGQTDVAVGGMKGCHVLVHEVKVQSKEEWQAAQPKPFANFQPQDSSPGGDPKSYPAVDEHGQPLNLDFETGTLADWEAGGDAFTHQPIRGDTVHTRRDDMYSRHAGDFWIGGYEKLQDAAIGTLTSRTFEVKHPFASFLIGGGGHYETRVELLEEDADQPFLRTSGLFAESMKRVSVDLTPYLGQRIKIRLVDESRAGWGHLNFDDFKFHDSSPAPLAAKSEPPAVVTQKLGLTPQQALAQMRLPPGFSVQLCASEPEIKQPIAMAIDDRGRLWVAEAYEYPVRAAEGQGKDQILVFTDHDGDGKFDERKVFAQGLNLVSGLEVGFGGVWVGAAPYLLFIPDRNRDDIPDQSPQVLLDGWGYEDTHETLNAFIWGPDGWLYGCHGVFTHSRVGKPGTPEKERIPLNAAIWRYHPLRHQFEVVSHGTSNPWGVDFNDFGHAFCTACVIPHLYHILPGARYQRQAGEHFNPHTYNDIKTIADHSHFVGHDPWAAIGKSDDQGGGHAHAGAMIYLGGAWPEQYRNQIFMNNIHGQRLNMDQLAVHGSGYVGSHGPDFLLTGDMASQMINLRYGPDGQVYVIDWYDMQACHTTEVGKHDRSNGRIYKIVYGESRPQAEDISQLSDRDLVERQLLANDWHVRHARRVLQERAAEKALAPETVARIREIAERHPEPTRRIRALWLLHVTNLASPRDLEIARRDAEASIRGWGVRLACEQPPRDASALRSELLRLAKADPSPIVRLEIASALQRLPVDRANWPIIQALASHGEDAQDHNLPLMVWFAMEPVVARDPVSAMEWAVRDGGALPNLRDFTFRRIAAIGSGESIELLTSSLLGNLEPADVVGVLDALKSALEGKKSLAAPKNWTAVSQKILSMQDPRLKLDVLRLGQVFGDSKSIMELGSLIRDDSLDVELRREGLQALALASLAPSQIVSQLLLCLEDSALRETAIRELARFDDPKIPAVLLDRYSSFSVQEQRAALVALCSRVPSAQALLAAMELKTIPSQGLSADLVRQLANLQDPVVTSLLQKVWGVYQESRGDKKAQIEAYKSLVLDPDKDPPDVMLGRAIFANTCQKCHTLYGVGAAIGPDLTGSNRADLDYLLSNIIDPSSVMAKEYQQSVITTSSGRVMTGMVLGQDDKLLRLQTVDSLEAIPLDEIEEPVAIDKSMMPDDQLRPMKEHEVRSLVAYLRGGQQNAQLATTGFPAVLFNGVDLSGWRGNPEVWSVEQGVIVGRTTGLARNEFLMSDICAEDFTLTVEVLLAGDMGNSGIQFRSEPTGDGDIRGYQADIGPTWWGKLYEEHGRELLASAPQEVPIRVNDWNEYRIEATGERIRTFLNGKLCVDLQDPEGARRGIFALQVHSGDATEVRFRKLRLEVKEP